MAEDKTKYTVVYKGTKYEIVAPKGTTNEQLISAINSNSKSYTKEISDPFPEVEKTPVPEKVNKFFSNVVTSLSGAVPSPVKEGGKIALGLGELALMLGTGTATSMVGGVAALGSGAVQAGYQMLPGEQPGSVGGATRFGFDYFNSFAYTPKTERGEDMAGFLANIFSLYDKYKDKWLGNPTLELTGSPFTATIAYTAPEIVASVIGLRKLRPSYTKKRDSSNVLEEQAGAIKKKAEQEARIKASENPIEEAAKIKIEEEMPSSKFVEYNTNLAPEEIISSSPHLSKILEFDRSKNKLRLFISNLDETDHRNLFNNITKFRKGEEDVRPLKIIRGEDGTLIPIGDATIAVAARLAGRDSLPVTIIEANRKGIESLLEVGKAGLKSNLASSIATAATVAVKEGRLGREFETAQKVMDVIADNVQNVDFTPGDLYRISEEYSLHPELLGKLFKDVYSEHGTRLAELSVFRREIRRLAEKDPKIKEFLRKTGLDDGPEVKDYGLVESLLQKTHNAGQFLRSMAIIQPITTARNILTEGSNLLFYQSIINPLTHVGRAFNQLIKSNPEAALRELKSTYNLMGGVRLAATKEGRKIIKALSPLKNKGQVYHSLLLNTPIHELYAGKGVTSVLNKLNELETSFVRRATFYAKLNELGRMDGINIRKIDPKDIPTEYYKKAYEHALEMTFSRMPRSPKARQFVRAFDNWGGWLIQMFPRFLFGNAIPWTINHSPLPFLSPTVWKQVMRGEIEGYESLAKASAGTSAIYASKKIAENLDKAGFPQPSPTKFPMGERDEEGNAKFIDLLAFTPVAGPLILGAVLHNIDKSLTPEIWKTATEIRDKKGLAASIEFLYNRANTGMRFSEWAETFLGANRTSDNLTGFIGIMGSDGDTLYEKAIQIIGNYLGIATIPAKVVKDLIGAYYATKVQMNPADSGAVTALTNEAQVPNVKYGAALADLFAPAIANIPGASNIIDPRALLGEGFIEPDIRQSQLSQLFRYNVNSLMSQEIDRLNIKPASISIKTGDKDLSNVANLYNHEMAERALAAIYKTKQWDKLSDATKQHIILFLYDKLSKPFGRAMAMQIRTKQSMKEKFMSQFNKIDMLYLNEAGVYPELLWEDIEKDIK